MHGTLSIPPLSLFHAHLACISSMKEQQVSSTLMTFIRPLSPCSVPIVKILDISESTKNSILTAEGMLLMVAVLLHGTMMLRKVREPSRPPFLLLMLGY